LLHQVGDLFELNVIFQCQNVKTPGQCLTEGHCRVLALPFQFIILHKS
jgi:hypothetical protein